MCEHREGNYGGTHSGGNGLKKSFLGRVGRQHCLRKEILSQQLFFFLFSHVSEFVTSASISVYTESGPAWAHSTGLNVEYQSGGLRIGKQRHLGGAGMWAWIHGLGAVLQVCNCQAPFSVCVWVSTQALKLASVS